MSKRPIKLLRTDYARDTYLVTLKPLTIFSGGRAVCPDGRARNLKRIAAIVELDTMTVDASVAVRGRTVAGFVFLAGEKADTYVVFEPYKDKKNAKVFKKR